MPDRHVNLNDESLYDRTRAEEFLWTKRRELDLSRREFLKLCAAGGAVLLAGAILPRKAFPSIFSKTERPIYKPTPSNLFYDRNGSNQEMRWENLFDQGYAVPNEMFFVRDHTVTPLIDAGPWRLQVQGDAISRPLNLTYDDVTKLPSVEVSRYIECAGNGRSFFKAAYGKEAAGAQWLLGGIGLARWRGVPLFEVLERAGVKKSARDVMVEGLDESGVRRPIPISKAALKDTILVYEMNGKTLPPDHGFPLRLLVPGWVGVANIKWAGLIQVSSKPIFTHWNTDLYVMIGPDYKPSPPRQGPAVTYNNVKSALELEWNGKIPAGRTLARGRAWSPFAPIAKVEYSFDRGKSWRRAVMHGSGEAGAWGRFSFAWNAEPGPRTIRLRATDAKGNSQPHSVPWNDFGYLYNGMVDHPLTVAG